MNADVLADLPVPERLAHALAADAEVRPTPKAPSA
ncbi:hypothetical protein FHR32_003321 [Streptosporangium album]|uniref:Uncharacterized protein n=1 Tax=Streptosporangium album TaxID=47479 RepID=A0A7W7W9L0_9ACTN|nr:hypothetical protein [Streptosporangium album]